MQMTSDAITAGAAARKTMTTDGGRLHLEPQSPEHATEASALIREALRPWIRRTKTSALNIKYYILLYTRRQNPKKPTARKGTIRPGRPSSCPGSGTPCGPTQGQGMQIVPAQKKEPTQRVQVPIGSLLAPFWGLPFI